MGVKKRMEQDGRGQAPGPWEGKERGQALVLPQDPAYTSLTTHTQPYHLATHLPQQTLRGDQMDLFWCPSNDLPLDCEGRRVCPFQGQMTGEPRSSPKLTERRKPQARGELGRSDLGLWGRGRTNRVLLSWKPSIRAGQKLEPDTGWEQGVCHSSNSV